MNIQQLEYLVALDTHRQFVLAAEKCHVTQPTLSMQLQKLEEELGVLLFDRTTKGVQPTAVGAKVVQQARRVLREVQQLREVVQVEKDELVGELRLGIIPTLAPYLVPLFLVELVERYPKLRVQVEELQSAQIIQQLKDNQLDIGLLVTPLDDRQLREIPVLEEPFLGYISENHELYPQATISPQDMGAPGLWLLQEGHCFRHQVLNICSPAPWIPPDPSPTKAVLLKRSSSWCATTTVILWCPSSRCCPSSITPW
ncbi:LysR substrate-binding domain-containing protein [Hymenobacter taeanensis]|uniref:LysR substrate-binding domain-containing protein n=1 Tax=Hymenobacter taeanensis TaxID=2735321 RepID=UPI0020A5C55B|nr:LysR substrate-binding domain-containing protein [Hymenobacter taeanensis]